MNDTDVRVVAAIQAFWKREGKSPTYAEVAQEARMATTTAYRAVRRLVNSGEVEVEDGKHRSLAIAPRPVVAWVGTMDDGRQFVVTAETEKRARDLIRFAARPGERGIADLREVVTTMSDLVATYHGTLELIVSMNEEDEA